jgi:hypothetical protein
MELTNVVYVTRKVMHTNQVTVGNKDLIEKRLHAAAAQYASGDLLYTLSSTRNGDIYRIRTAIFTEHKFLVFKLINA